MADEGPAPRMLLGSLDEVLSDLDTILPDDPDEVVQAFVQAGGNGGGEAAAVLQEWAAVLGVSGAQDVMAALMALNAEAEPADPAELGFVSRPGQDRWPLDPYT